MPAFVRAAKPHLTPPEIEVEVEAFWAAPTRSEYSPAPHETGGAVDLTLTLARNAEPLPMGTIFDDMSTAAALDHYESPDRVVTTTDREARGNRRLLYWLMDREGFAANPNEWWHFSWGDQLWARLTGAPAAMYGLATFGE
jgi:D-alanyl-D-alanine dipeptidase